MKIGIACKAFQQSGGLERYTLDIVAGLNRMGIRPTVFARRFDSALLQRFDIVPQLIRAGALPGKLRDHYFSRRVEVLKKRLRIDLLIGVNRTLGSDIAICGGTHRGFLQASKKVPSWSDKWQVGLESAQYAHAQKIVAHSGMMVDELVNLYGVPAEKIALLYPPVDAAQFSPVSSAEKAALRERLKLPHDKTVFLFPSSSHHRKGYPALSAFFEKTDLPVILAVAGRPIHNESSTIRYLGYQTDMADVYRAVDYTILASRYEPFGLVGIESILCGTPVALDSRIACTEVLSDQACLTFDAERPEDLERVITQALARHDVSIDTSHGELDKGELAANLAYDPDIDVHVAAILALLPNGRSPHTGIHHGGERRFHPPVTA